MTEINLPEIITRAREVDLLNDREFRQRCENIHIPEPIAARSKWGELFMAYGQEIDGRVIAVKFLSYAEKRGYELEVTRPTELDDPRFIGEAISELNQGPVLQRIMQPGSIGQAGILSYSEGDIHLRTRENTEAYELRGALPKTKIITLEKEILASNNNLNLIEFYESLQA